MKTYNVSFTGREAGAIGIFYRINLTEEAKNIVELMKDLYEKYDHFQKLVINGFSYLPDGSLITKTKEFKRGDIVTFHPYEDTIKAKVLEVYEEADGSVMYRLEGISQNLISRCSGNSLEESKYYKQIEQMD